jgi:hypothetical protein
VKILVFAPHAEIWAHAFPEALVVEALKKQGHTIVYVGCGAQLQRFCVPMSGHKLTPLADDAVRHSICSSCRENDRIIRSSFGLTGPDLAELIDRDDELEAENMISSLSNEALLAFERDGIPLGKIASYQLILRTKRVDTDFSEKEWLEYRVEFRNTFYAWRAATKLFDSEKPDRLLVYNALYSVNRVFCKIAEKRGIPHYFAHAGGNLSNRLQTLWIGRGDTFSFMPHLIEQWPRFSEMPCNESELSLITDHYLELLRGGSAFVYSTPKSSDHIDIRARFGVAPNQKLVLATLGSYDEEWAAELIGARVHRKAPIFPDQVAWIRALIGYVAQRSDRFLLLRVHPREFPNKRDSALSQHARELKRILINLPPGVAVNWPEDRISMYDLADQADVVLNSWSSVGKEMALLGLPVVTYAPEIPFYPEDIGYSAQTTADYFATIEEALADGWSFERIRRSYRWYAFEFIKSTIFLGNDFPKRESSRSLPDRLIGRIDRAFGLKWEQMFNCLRRSGNLEQSGLVATLLESKSHSIPQLLNPCPASESDLAAETAVLKREIRRLADALFSTKESRSTSRLYPVLVGAG